MAVVVGLGRGVDPHTDVERLRRAVLGGALTVTTIGLTIGIPASWGMGQALSRYVTGAVANAVTPYLSVATLLIAVTLIAAWIPARRASIVDPASALRSE